ncbi:SH3 domain-containing protein [Streptomyces sp. NPDC006512]|uniref:SH3 domain-containing protein n=1 Tax=Streptomyces sp. NPDC006512 TaxID=3154307 RepID=UPI0033B6FF4B
MVKKALLTYALAAGVLIGPLGTAGWAADGLAAGGRAQAAAHPVGVVDSRAALNVREKPTVYSKVVKKLRPNQRVALSCQKRGGWVDGNPVWYRLHGSKGWVSARYVHNLQPVRPC